ncbi:conserved protein of unknown function [Pseudomonas sp. JV551A1]|uniref:Type II secretion system protein GspC N-terminal domain-containing protein n=2 Tax=Pseudomonas TaxID=286 RepID=A0AAQ1PE66_9PSED|nr:conserved protein of unknown function [Pseudomonas sp. JV551A1]SPO64106.1 conserved protein of unknown function [Pseudomonas inefficax]
MKRLLQLSWLALPLVTLGGLVWRESASPVGVSHIAARPVVQAPSMATAALPEQPLSAATLALAFGFEVPGRRPSRREDIALKASFVSSDGDARALVKSQSGEVIYRVGDRLPGHGVLRRINVDSIVLWIDGREEVVSLVGNVPSVFLPKGAATRSHHVSNPSPRLLREVQ